MTFFLSTLKGNEPLKINAYLRSYGFRIPLRTVDPDLQIYRVSHQNDYESTQSNSSTIYIFTLNTKRPVIECVGIFRLNFSAI